MSSVIRLVLMTLTLVVLVVSYWIYNEHQFENRRAQLLDSGRLRATQITEAARQQLAASFRAVDFLFQDVRRNLDRTPEDFRKYADAALRLLPASAEAQIAVYDAQGRRTKEAGRPAALADIADMPFFAELKGAGKDFLVVEAPQKDVWREGWVMPMLRPVLKDGVFDGAVALTVSPHYLSNSLARMATGPGDMIGAIHLPDGTYLARSSDIDLLLGRAVKPGRPYFAKDAPDSGYFVDEATHEPVERIYAWARVSELPVVLFLGLSTAELLAPLEAEIARHRRTSLLITFALLGLIAIISILWLRAARQSEEVLRQRAFYHALFEQNRSIKILSDPGDGHIISVNAAAVDFYGYTREQFSLMHVWDVNCLPKDEILRIMQEASTGKKSSFIFPHRLSSGEVRTVEVFSGPVDIDGRKALYSIIHDVTDRFRLEHALRDSEVRYRTIFETMPAGMLLIDENGGVAAVNETALQILQTDIDVFRSGAVKLYGMDGELLPFNRHPRARCLTEEFRDELYAAHDPQGRRIWLNVNGRPLSTTTVGGPHGGVVAFTDVTQTIHLQEASLTSERVFEVAIEGIVVTDRQGGIVRVNPAFRDITGYSLSDVIGRTPSFMSEELHDAAFFEAIEESLFSKNTWQGEVSCRRKDGRLLVARVAMSAILMPDGRQSGAVALFSDVTAIKQKEAETWKRANFDTLTALPNRTLLLDRMDQAIVRSRREKVAVGVLFIDLDKFKPVNDEYGHAAGDELLRQVASRITATVREEDTVARLGGDEFVVLMPIVESEQEASRIAERVLARLCEPFSIAPADVSISACIGVVYEENGVTSSASMLSHADAAMYRGKAAGRSRVIVATREDDATSAAADEAGHQL